MTLVARPPRAAPDRALFLCCPCADCCLRLFRTRTAAAPAP